MSEQRVRLGDFELDMESGELHRVAGGEPGEEADEREATVRLQPQPAQVLALLVRKEGGLLSREELRDAVWPDTEIELDQSINFCIRQVRAALGDSASAPRYVETLPRRGYRLLTPVTWLDDRNGPASTDTAPTDAMPADPAPTDAATPAARARRKERLWIGLGAALVLIAVLGLSLRNASGPAPAGSVRIAVMPFDLQAEATGVSADTGRISEWITAELTRRISDRAGILGPRSTVPYRRQDADLRTVFAELEIDYLVNSRFLVDEGRPGLLVELIRGTDGAHIWVDFFTELEAWQEVGNTVTDNVIATLNLGNAP